MKRVVVVALRHPEHENMFLHLLRSDNGRWSAPAGHALPGELPIEAARRELFEETGVDLNEMEELRNGEYPDEAGGQMQVHLFSATCDPTRFSSANDPDKEGVTFKYLDPSTHDAMHVPTERNIIVDHLTAMEKAEETLEKMGVMRRRAPFDPTQGAGDDYDLNDWQNYESTSEVDDEDTDRTQAEQLRDVRDSLSSMDPNALLRGIHRLHALTQTRRNPLSGETEFLLHRGMSDKEHKASVRGSKINHDENNTSWTPDLKTAEGFSKEYNKQHPWSKTKEEPGHVVSAWISQSKIHSIPKMYGSLSGRGPGKNKFHHENEIIVKPGHNSQLGQPSAPREDIHAKISSRQPGNTLSDQHANAAYWKAAQNAIAHLHPTEQKKIMNKMKASMAPKPIKLEPPQASKWDQAAQSLGVNPKKLAASEVLDTSLAKAERPPRSVGEKHPTDPYLVGRHHRGISAPAWHASPEAAKVIDQKIAAGIPKFLETIPESHKSLVANALGQVMRDPSRHFRIGFDKHPKDQVLRARHVNALLSGEKHVNMDLSTPGQAKLTIGRHRGIPGEGTTWTLTGQGGHQKGITHVKDDLRRSEEQALHLQAGEGSVGVDGRQGSLPDEPAGVRSFLAELRASGHRVQQDGVLESAQAAQHLDRLISLEKGKAGDWRKEGYKLQYHAPQDKHGPYSMHSVTAHDAGGKMVGSLQAEDLGDGHFQAHIVEVHPLHQRKGLATAMYVAMQKKTGLKASPDLEAQTQEGRKLWSQKGRPFGKAESIPGTNCANCKFVDPKEIPIKPEQQDDGGGLKDYTDAELKRAEAADLVTLPGKKVCKYAHLCKHKQVRMNVTERMCCAFWDNKDAERAWEDTTKSEASDRETEVIKKNRKTDEARRPHDFKAAKWTHPNGHPRCFLCGDEERTGGKCVGADHDGLSKSDYYGRGLPMGWISPQGEFHEIGEDDHHRYTIPEEAGVPAPEHDDDEEPLLAAYNKGWISTGHAGEFNIQGHSSHLKNRMSPAMKTARQLAQNVMNQSPEETHMTVYNLSAGPTQIAHVPVEHFVRHGTILPKHVQKSELSKSSETVKIAVVVLRSGSSILVGKRTKNDKWGLPGGRFEDDESKEEVAIREVREETGLKLKQGDLIFNGAHEIKAGGERKKIYVFTAEFPGGEPTTENDPDEEFSEWRWVHAEDGKLPKGMLEDKFAPPAEAAFEHLDMTKAERSKADPLGTDEDQHAMMNRVEDKYLVRREHLEEITRTLKEKLQQGDIDTSVRYNVNKSIYMDNKDLDAYRDSVDDIKPRFKVRIRQYAPNGKDWEDVAYVELKIKAEGGMSRKVRVRIPASMIDSVISGKEISVDETLYDLNRDITKDQLRKRVMVTNTVIEKYGFRKQLMVTYERRAYSSDKIRVTIDENLKYHEAQPVHDDVAQAIKASSAWAKYEKRVRKAQEKDFLVVEVKHEEAAPGWVKDMLDRAGAKEVKFSKYCAAVTTFMSNNGKTDAPVLREKKIDADSVLAQLGYGEISKSEGLVKMSRPRITFPKLGLGSEDHNVSVIATPQQKNVMARAVANEVMPKVPADQRMKVKAGKQIQAVVGGNRGRLGGAVVHASNPEESRSKQDKPFGFALGGKYQQKKGPAYSKAPADVKLQRQKELNTRIRHEGDYLVFSKLAARLGSHEAKGKVLSKLLEHAFPDAHDRNTIFSFTKARGYNPLRDRNRNYVEEMINTIQDVLTDDKDRRHFERWYFERHGHMPGFLGTQKMTSRLKAGWGRLAAAAQNVDESFAKAEYLSKAMDSQYVKDAHGGHTLLVPVTVAGQKELAPGIPHHITVKMFRKPGEPLDPEKMKRIEADLDRFKLTTPHPSQLRFEPDSFVSPRSGKTYYALKVHGMPKEYSEVYNHFKDIGVTFPEYLPHITIDKGMYDKIQSGELPLDRLDVQVHHPELKLGPNTLKVYKSGT